MNDFGLTTKMAGPGPEAGPNDFGTTKIGVLADEPVILFSQPDHVCEHRDIEFGR